MTAAKTASTNADTFASPSLTSRLPEVGTTIFTRPWRIR